MCAISPEERINLANGIESLEQDGEKDKRILAILKENPEMAKKMQDLLSREKDLVEQGHFESSYKHCFDVANLAKALLESGDFEELRGLDARQQDIFLASALFHDIGKAEVDLELLTKRGKLTVEQYEAFKGHPQVGFETCREFMSNKPDTETVAEIVFRHHTYKKNKPYPPSEDLHPSSDQDTEEMIGNFSRFIALIDAFDSLRSFRPYRDPEHYRENVRETLLADFPDQGILINYLVTNFIFEDDK